MKKLIIIQVVSPDYREKFFEHLQKTLGNSFCLYSGDEDFQKTIKPEHKILKIKIINKFLFDRSFLFQLGSHWRELFKKNIIIYYIINNIFASSCFSLK